MTIEDMGLPWSATELQSLAEQLIERGEAPKVDLKVRLDLSGASAHADILKDISALANTFDWPNHNHGFIIIGAQAGALTYTSFTDVADHLQATIDELVKHHIEPFIHTRLYQFGPEGRSWGVLVIPPTRNAPHVFVKDIQKRNRGDIYVRRGTVTERALPTDYARFFRQHLDEHAYEQKVALRELSQRTAALEAGTSVSMRRVVSLEAVATATRHALPDECLDLLTQIDLALATDVDPIRRGLQREAEAIRHFLRGSDLPWDLQIPSKEECGRLLESIEDRCRTYWRALAKLVSLDASKRYEDTVIEALDLLAYQVAAPNGQTFTGIGLGIRYYPLVVALHIVFTLGIRKQRAGLLSRCAHLTLEPTNDYDDAEHIGAALFIVRDADPVFQTQNPAFPGQRWCDAVAMRIRPLVESVVDIPGTSGTFDRAFFPGEFLLALVPLEPATQPEMRRGSGFEYPSSGNFLYFRSASRPISRFLSSEVLWVEKVFRRPLREILEAFDQNAHRVVGGGGCWGGGFAGGAVQAAYPGTTTADKQS